jgi:hypothetical protein
MPDPRCENCEALANEIPIPTPGRLTKLLDALRALVRNSVLVCVEKDPGNVSFEELSADGPWDDILGYTFECQNCSRRFSLFCDTYHGRGCWRPVKDDGA